MTIGIITDNPSFPSFHPTTNLSFPFPFPYLTFPSSSLSSSLFSSSPLTFLPFLPSLSLSSLSQWMNEWMNEWMNSSWKKPVWVKEIPMGEIEQGPILTGNVPSYQWNWRIMSDEKGAVNTEGFQRNLQTNQKYRLRISGDGKDLQRNPDLECYQEGDIMPGVTRSFYVVDNVELPTYEPLAIPDGAPSVWTFKGWTSFLSLFTTTLLILFYLLI